MKGNKSLTKNSLFYILYNVLNVLFPLITGIYAARVIIPENIGMVESARNLVQYFVILSFLGIPTYGLREISKHRNNKAELNKVYSELMIINFISTCFFGLTYLLLIFSIPLYRAEVYLYLLVGILIFLNIFNNSWLYEGLEEFKYISIRNLVFKIICFVFLIVFVRDSNDYYYFASVYVIGTAGNYILNIINSRKIVDFSIKNINLKRHMKSIIYLVFVNLAIEIYTLVDITMLGFLCDKSNVTYYSYGMKIYRILYQVISTFTIVVVPRLSLVYNDNKEQFNELLSKTFKIIIMLSVPLIIGIWFVSNYFICLLYGDGYISSSYVLKILSISLLIAPIGYLLGSRVLLITGQENKMIIPVSLGAIINVFLNYFLILKFNEIGAAIASVCSELVVMFIYLFLSKNKFKLIKLNRTIINVLISSVLMIAYLILFIFLNSNLIFNIFAVIGSVVIYFTSMIILKDEIVLGYYNMFKNKFFANRRFFNQ